MTVTVIVGTQWGDEGKGKAVDVLASKVDVVVRFQGGNNAGHTLVVKGKKTVLHLIPSGALYPNLDCYLARGVVIHPETLLKEIRALEEAGHELRERLFLSKRAPIIMDWHLQIDALREGRTGSIGTTKKGIGPAYEQFIARQAVLAGDLGTPALVEEKIRTFYSEKAAQIGALSGALSSLSLEEETEKAIRAFHKNYEERYAPLVPLVADVEAMLRERVRRGDQILMEGAQGTFLDIGMGTYPFVTSSHTTSAGACVGAGLAPRDIDHVIGICKAYTTRVGDGPFATELDFESGVGKHLQQVGHEFGATTGRPRRCGWLDLVVLRDAIEINGCDQIVLTKLDVLSGLKTLEVATGYDEKGSPEYKRFPGWEADLSAVRSFEELPREAQHYVTFIQDFIAPYGSRISQISVGPGRQEIFAI